MISVVEGHHNVLPSRFVRPPHHDRGSLHGPPPALLRFGICQSLRGGPVSFDRSGEVQQATAADRIGTGLQLRQHRVDCAVDLVVRRLGGRALSSSGSGFPLSSHSISEQNPPDHVVRLKNECTVATRCNREARVGQGGVGKHQEALAVSDSIRRSACRSNVSASQRTFWRRLACTAQCGSGSASAEVTRACRSPSSRAASMKR